MNTGRRRIVVAGRVQGVGFRPFVYNAATALELSGHVKNTTAGVTIEIEGSPDNLAAFRQRLLHDHPAPAIVKIIDEQTIPCSGDSRFVIRPSDPDGERFVIPMPDIPVCDNCMAEARDNTDRRHGYAMNGCAVCGPRFTVMRMIPYDRHVTSMDEFPMCDRCRAEYENPADRRFHAQLITCPECGPEIALRSNDGERLATGLAAVARTAQIIVDGGIAAIKGLGGYHLACDATNNAAVLKLRERKRRDGKPFAVMARDIEAARALCEISAAEEALLTGPRRPVTLLRKKPDCRIAPDVAPGNSFLGTMLPYTPIHHFLLDNVGRPLVMTSGNFGGEPIVFDDSDALEVLAPVADVFLTHNRKILARCDDSVARIWRGSDLLIRRSRGYAPEPVELDREFSMRILACGAELKNAFCMTTGSHAFMSQHIGDLESGSTVESFESGIENFARMLKWNIEAAAHDAHPEYISTKYALALPGDIPRIAVQHHHAHIVSCMAENGERGPVIGAAFDGLGYGPDGAMWGGEFLLADRAGFERAAHLRYVPMPGGNTAIREPWRMALSWFREAGEEFDGSLFNGRIAEVEIDVVSRMIKSGLNSPMTSSMGRLFDAAAAIALGIDRSDHEGHAAMAFEQAAEPTGASGSIYDFAVKDVGGPLIIDPSGIIIGVVEDVRAGAPVGGVSARFHRTIATVIADVCGFLRDKNEGLNIVALSGGVFQNALLLDLAADMLEKRAFKIITHRRVPPNDGGLALGQAVVADELLKGEY